MHPKKLFGALAGTAITVGRMDGPPVAPPMIARAATKTDAFTSSATSTPTTRFTSSSTSAATSTATRASFLDPFTAFVASATSIPSATFTFSESAQGTEVDESVELPGSIEVADSTEAAESTEVTESADSCPMNKGFVPLQELPDADVCSSKNQDSYSVGIFDSPDTCPVPIGSNGERMYHWLPKGKSLESRRAQHKEAGLNPDNWAPWTHRPVCGDKGKYCVFANAAIKALPVGAQPEIVVRESTPSLTDGTSFNATNANITVFTPEKNALYDSKWGALPGKYTDAEAVFQGVSILTTPEMAAGDLHLNNFALDAKALAQFNHFATLPPSYKIQKIEDLPEVPYKETDLEDRREKFLKEKKEKEERAEIKQQFLDAQKKYEEAEKNKSVDEDAQDEPDNEGMDDDTFPDPDMDEDDDGADGDDFGDIVIDDAAPEESDADSEVAAQKNAYRGFTDEMKAFAERNKNPHGSATGAPIEHSTSKGWGAVADRDIKAGEPIIMERPAMIAHDTLLIGGNDDLAVHGTHMGAHEDDHGLGLESVEKRAHLWKAMVDNLPPAAAARVRSLHVLPKYRGDFQERPEGLDAMNKTSNEYITMDQHYRHSASQLSLEEKLFDSNALAIRINGYPLKGLFPRIAALNHGCVPNTVMTWSEAPMAMVTYAKRDIKKGEELTVNYLDADLTFKAREMTNGKRFNFKCQCSLCRDQRADPEARVASNNRRDLLKFEIPSIVKSSVEIGRLDLALQAFLVAGKALAEEGLRQPGTVREAGIGLFAGMQAQVQAANDSVQSHVLAVDAFGPAGVTFEFGELLANQGKLKESLPYLRAALVEIAWRSAGYMSERQETMQDALITLIDAIETRISRRDLLRGGDGVSVLKAEPSSEDALEPTMETDEIVAEINQIIDQIEMKDWLETNGRQADETC